MFGDPVVHGLKGAAERDAIEFLLELIVVHRILVFDEQAFDPDPMGIRVTVASVLRERNFKLFRHLIVPLAAQAFADTGEAVTKLIREARG